MHRSFSTILCSLAPAASRGGRAPLALVALLLAAACTTPLAPGVYEQDFAQAVQDIGVNYAYFDVKATRWADVRPRYAADLRGVQNREQFVVLLEQLVDELADPHAQLDTNSPRSWRLVPSGTDLWAEWRDGAAVITQVRAGSDAARAGIRPNTVVLAVDGQPVGDVVRARIGRTVPPDDADARDWALRSVLAGRHATPRVFDLQEGGARRNVTLAAADQFGRPADAVTTTQIAPGVGYVRLNDSLGDNATVAAFDAALMKLRDTRALIVDLRNTASGGNSTVARGILGRFVQADLPYQRHLPPYEERTTGIRRSWIELVSPRGPFTYTGRVAVLVDHWTGSMGEGLAIGFDATHAGTVVGTPMARLLGATERITLARTGIGINVPTEKLFHVDGSPREAFVPRVAVDPAAGAPGEDPFVTAALRVLAQR